MLERGDLFRAQQLESAAKKAGFLIATLAALVLGLLVGSVHTSFDPKGDAIARRTG